jgi:hypothetical protein
LKKNKNKKKNKEILERKQIKITLKKLKRRIRVIRRNAKNEKQLSSEMVKQEK